MPKVILILLVFMIFTVIEWQPWYDWNSQQSEKASPEVVVDMKTDQNLDKNKFELIRAQLTPLTFTTLAAELNARVDQIHVKEGQTFKKGQVLLSFECSSQRAQLDRGRALLAIAERNYQANKKLLALGSVGRIEFENSESEFQKVTAETKDLEALVNRCRILAPFEGSIVEQKIRSQQYVQSGQPLLDILGNTGLELEFIVASRWAAVLVFDYPFSILIDETQKTYPAKITRVVTKIDPISQTFKVAAKIDGQFPELTAGMSGTVNLGTMTQKSAEP